MSQQSVKYLRDYQRPHYEITAVRLTIDIHPNRTRVTSELDMQRHPGASPLSPLVLDGEEQTLVAVEINDNPLSPQDYQHNETELTIHNVPEAFTLRIHSEICPESNTALEGLFTSRNMYLTQCEANGFRRITYYLDRPDVMSTFTCKIIADKQQCPVLLSNGNKIEAGDLPNNRHYAIWHDPFRKPCYLFALVAGDLAVLKDSFTTHSGRHVALEIYASKADIEKCHYAMTSVKQAMRWDEEAFGREYDLDIYMIVATPDFNMGAMENKGLNIFNTKYVLANAATSTDTDYQHVQAVIGHEYFHNWTGNRITCRDWFQLSLKEGLTVFRDQEFTADHHSRAVKRIEDAKIIRGLQFAEDASPMAHPVRPDSYIEMNNFYTVTVYNKGAEVIRMQHTLLGPELFRKGMDLYFTRHDGQAVTCDDFVKAMEDASGIDLTQFKLWYSQAGTPQLQVSDHYDASTETYTLTIKQTCPATSGQFIKLPFHIPVKMGLISQTGQILTSSYQGNTAEQHLLELTQPQQQFVFTHVKHQPVPSLLRDFSAPVKVDYPYTEAQLQCLFAHDPNTFTRWDAGQILASRLILQLAEAAENGQALSVPPAFCQAIRSTLLASHLDKALIAEAITLPSEKILSEMVSTINPQALHQAREFVLNTLAHTLQTDLLTVYKQNHELGEYHLDGTAIAKRRLKNACLAYLTQQQTDLTAEGNQLALRQFHEAKNMTDQYAAFNALLNSAAFADGANAKAKDQLLEAFYQQWQHEALVVDKWLMAQANCKHTDTGKRVLELLSHPAFDIKNPNKVYALLINFGNNMTQFHNPDGSGYRLMQQQIAKIDGLNPQVASRLARTLMSWKRYTPALQALMKHELEALAKLPQLSKDVYEIVSKSIV